MWQCFCLCNTVNCQQKFIILSCKTLTIQLDNTASHSMAQKKNCDKRRQENLPKLPPEQPVVSQQPIVEDITDSESDEFDDEDNILKEIQTDSELLAFAL